MATIVTGNADEYVKQLLSEEFGHGTNEDNRSPNTNHSDGKTAPNASQDIFKDRLKLHGKKA